MGYYDETSCVMAPWVWLLLPKDVTLSSNFSSPLCSEERVRPARRRVVCLSPLVMARTVPRRGPGKRGGGTQAGAGPTPVKQRV